MQKMVVHWCGYDSREVIQMCELKNMNELEVAFDQHIHGLYKNI